MMKATHDGPGLLGLRDVAQLLRCSPRHVSRMVERGCIPEPLKVGTLRRWPARTIGDWINQGCPVAPGGIGSGKAVRS